MALTPETVAQIAHQAGFRDEQLVQMVAIGKAESGWNPSAHRSDRPKSELSGDRGLFQINHIWDDQLRAAGIISSPQDLFDPATNARAAKYIWDRQGIQAWDMSKSNWSKGSYQEEARRAVQGASSTGLLGTSYSGGGGVGPADVEANLSEPFDLPGGAEIFSTVFGDVAIFSVAPGVNIQYLITPDSNVRYDRAKVQSLSNEQWEARFPPGSITEAGDAIELAGVSAVFGTFGNMWDSVVGSVMGYRNPAKDDPEVLQVLAEFARRPNMSEAEFQNKLQDTEWFQTRTQDELAWNDLGEAERAKRIAEAESRMIGMVFQFAGVDVGPDDPRVKNYIEDVASGRLGYGAYGEVIKGLAAEDPESPHSRTVRTEEENQRQRPIDIENTAQRIRETVERWGVGWSANTIQQWAKDMVEKRKSDEDLVMELRNQARVLYPWKDPETETATAAAPWIETYRRVMEKPGSLNTGAIQKALQSGQAVFDFETELKKSDGWLETKNGQNEMYSMVSELGSRMGFV